MNQTEQAYFGRRLGAAGSSALECDWAHKLLSKVWSKLWKQMRRESARAQLRLKHYWHNEEIIAGTKTHDSEKLFNLVSRRSVKNVQENHRHAEKQTNKLLAVIERA